MDIISNQLQNHKTININKVYRVVDLFSGVGGLSYGFSNNQNFKIILANEFDSTIASAYQLNHPDVIMLNQDIKTITNQVIKKYIKKDIDVIIGGPPCQSYSTLGKRKMDDRSQLFNEYCRILKILKPKIFIFENVKGLLSINKGNLFKTIQNSFKAIGYNLKFKILNSANFGVPQFRERVILVGTLIHNTFIYPMQTHGEIINYCLL